MGGPDMGAMGMQGMQGMQGMPGMQPMMGGASGSVKKYRFNREKLNKSMTSNFFF